MATTEDRTPQPPIVSVEERIEELLDLFELISWKEIYGHLEAAIDGCEQTAKLIGTVVIKYA